MTDKKNLKTFQGRAKKDTSWKDDAKHELKERYWMDYSFSIALAVVEELNEQYKSQAWLAEQLGVSRQYLSKLLKGKENLTLETIAKLSSALGKELIQVRDA